MYNPYQFQNPYPNYQNYFQNQPQQEQVTQVNGRASVEQIKLAPNSSKLVMDTSAPIVWLCVSDGVGRVTATPYDIVEHREAPQVDVSGMEARVTRLEQIIEGLERGRQNDKPDAGNARQDRPTGYTEPKHSK